jgi:outer membrane protein OmpA-like peptidoglycan-associated protein
MGETPEKPSEGSVKSDRRPPKDREKAAAADAQRSWHKRARETRRDSAGKLRELKASGASSGEGGGIALRDASGITEGKLSASERAERGKIAQPRDGVGFGFAKDKPPSGELQRWYKGLSDAQRAALRDPKTIVTVTATCSKPGSHESNLDLSRRRAENVKDLLAKELGIDRSRIRTEWLGEDPAQDNNPDAPDAKDDHQERVALINFETKATKEKPSKPERKEKPEESIERAKKVLERNPPKEANVRKRLTALLEKLSDPKVDDAYIDGRSIVPQDQPGNEMPPDELAKHARSEVHRIMTTPHAVHVGGGRYEMRPPSDELLRQRLERLDREILSGPNEVNRRMAIQGVTASPWLVRVNNWIEARQSRRDSIMGTYGKYHP